MLHPARYLVALFAVLLVGCRDKEAPLSENTSPAVRGEQAFSDTLNGVRDRSVEAVALLEAAVAQNPRDGRSYLLLGMMRMLRFKRGFTDARSAGDVLQLEIRKAQDALDAAVRLLPNDRRVPGFRGAATYLHGVVSHDEMRISQGLIQMRAAIDLFRDFNLLAFVDAVAPFTGPQDPLYDELMGLVSAPPTAACNPLTLPELCGDAGKAPHNLEGGLLLWGDVFAKAGNESQARSYYRLAQMLTTNGSKWRFAALAAQRLDTLPQRIALYQDGDPTNDPQIVGYGKDACGVCHYK